ncbi:hypothetical protein AB0H92_36985 [Streptomyces phaeochromogenes]|uniref:hypothetical protein n=1 Tax=Streptomyces phaeochromogenes TaxID=1923 RepID=UPI0033F0BB54
MARAGGEARSNPGTGAGGEAVAGTEARADAEAGGEARAEAVSRARAVLVSASVPVPGVTRTGPPVGGWGGGVVPWVGAR